MAKWEVLSPSKEKLEKFHLRALENSTFFQFKPNFLAVFLSLPKTGHGHPYKNSVFIISKNNSETCIPLIIKETCLASEYLACKELRLPT